MKIVLLSVVLASATVLLGACTTDPYYEYEQPVRMAPPSPYSEYPGYSPVVGHVWVTGYWNWAGVRYVWVPGRWEAPRPGYLWVPHRWERDGDHWRRHGGRWERDPHQRVAPVSPPAPRPRMERQDNLERHDNHRPGPAPTFRPPPERESAPERNVAPRIEYENRRPAVEGSRLLPGRHAEPRAEPRVERETRPVPERDGDARAVRKDSRRPHSDDDRRENRRDRNDER